MPDIRLIKYFLATVEERNITRAANRLGIQQPPLSVQLKKLEERVGAQLLKRVPSGVEPTAAGMVLYTDFREILEQLDAAVENAKRIDRGYSGKLVLGVTHSSITHTLTKTALSDFLNQHKDVSVEIVTAGSRELCSAMAEGRIDLGFIRPTDTHNTQHREDALVSEPMVVAAHSKHEIAVRSNSSSMKLDALLAHRVILYRDSTDPTLYNDTIAAFSRQGVALENIQVCPSANIALDLVSAGLGVSIVPKSLSERVVQNVEYFKLPKNIKLLSKIVLATRRGDTNMIALEFRRVALDLRI